MGVVNPLTGCPPVGEHVQHILTAAGSFCSVGREVWWWGGIGQSARRWPPLKKWIPLSVFQRRWGSTP